MAGGTGIAGVTVWLSGAQSGSASTDASGNYTLKSLVAGGTYTVKPSKTGYVFNPVSQTFSGLSGNQTANYTGTGVFTISGKVVDAGGAAVSGVTMTLSGSQSKTATTSSTGTYSFTGLAAGGNYTVTPAKVNFTFTPPSQTFNNLGANQTANFAGAPK